MWSKFAGQEQPNVTRPQVFFDLWQRTNQSLEISIVVVVTDEKESQSIASRLELLSDFRSKGRVILGKCVAVKPVVDGDDRLPGPLPQVLGKRTARRDDAIRAPD